MIVLRWKNPKWRAAPWRCRLFGHVWKDGWFGDKPYLVPEPGPVDGIGRHHVRLRCKCSRCNCSTVIAYVHDWAKEPLP